MTSVPGDGIDWGTFEQRWDIVRRRRPPEWARGTPKLLRGNLEWGLIIGIPFFTFGIVRWAAAGRDEGLPFVLMGGFVLGIAGVVALRLWLVVRRIRRAEPAIE